MLEKLAPGPNKKLDSDYKKISRYRILGPRAVEQVAHVYFLCGAWQLLLRKIPKKLDLEDF